MSREMRQNATTVRQRKMPFTTLFLPILSQRVAQFVAREMNKISNLEIGCDKMRQMSQNSAGQQVRWLGCERRSAFTLGASRPAQPT
jgi:hypothetical protein